VSRANTLGFICFALRCLIASIVFQPEAPADDGKSLLKDATDDTMLGAENAEESDT
jgi:hypothetical protein